MPNLMETKGETASASEWSTCAIKVSLGYDRVTLRLCIVVMKISLPDRN